LDGSLPASVTALVLRYEEAQSRDEQSALSLSIYDNEA